MIVRVGIHPSPRYGAELRRLGAAGLISANALRKKDGNFRRLKSDAFGGLKDLALDSAGFVAMMRYGGYPWSAESYVDFAASWPWVWWASMDLCCEPQVAGSRDTIRERVTETALRYRQCSRLAEERGASPPMPVLQGWRPDDYRRSAELTGDLPPLVGLGSVCRRSLGGKDGIYAVVGALDRALPPSVKLHLFGIKGAAIRGLLGHPRIHSVDSMAWDYMARRQETHRPVTTKLAYMGAWWRRQTAEHNLFAQTS